MSNMSNMARDAAKDAKDAAKETCKAASAASGDIKADLQALREDVTHLTEQVADILGSKGSDVWNRAKSNLDGVISDVESKRQEAVEAVRDVGDTMKDALDESISKRPYTTLAIAFGLGFLFGVMRR